MMPSMFSRRKHKRRTTKKLAATAVAAVAGFAGPAMIAAPAQAGTFEISGCFNSEQYSWSPHKSGGVDVYTECPGGPLGSGKGIAARNIQGTGTNAANGSVGFHRFVAPSGTTLTRIRGYWGFSAGDGWKAGLYRPETASWVTSTTMDRRISGGAIAWESMDMPLVDAATTKLELMVRCGASVGCPTDFNAAGALGSELVVTVNDPSAPGLSNGQGLWTHDNWVSGNQSVNFDASDNTGLKHSWVDIDSGPQYGRRDFHCDYRFTVPCTGGTQATPATIPTANFADGTHTMRLVAYDAAGNPAIVSKTIKTDNTAPHAPVLDEQVAENSAGWTTSEQVRFTYADPQDGKAPVNKIHVDVCKTGGTCNTQTIAPSGGKVTGNDTITLPSEGTFTVKARLSDAAGNTGATSSAFTVQYETTPPGAAATAEANGWLNRDEAAKYSQDINGLSFGEINAVSGLAGFAVTTDGNAPGTTVTDGWAGATASKTLNITKEGVTTVKARAISKAGNASTKVTSVDLPVDLTDPTASVSGAPVATSWHAKQVDLTIKGVDPLGQNNAAASGMAPALVNEAHTSGAYVEYSLDGRAFQAVKGDEATVSVGDGEHTVEYRSVDLAGNKSATKTTTFKVDQAAPSPVAFEMPDASAPSKVTVVASDATSGVKSGQVQIRNLDTNGAWTNLGGALSPDADGRMVASTKDAPAGRHQLRAVVTDHAGNSTITERTVNGTTYEITVPKAPTTNPGDNTGPTTTTPPSGGIVDSRPGEFVPGAGVTPGLTAGGGYKGGNIGNGHSGKGNPDGTKTQVTSGLVQKSRGKITLKKCPKRGTTAKSKARAAKCVAKHKAQKKLAKRGEKLVNTMKVGFGKAALLRGSVTTTAGKAIANGEVVIWSELKSAWAAKGNRAFTKIATVKTNAQGAFAYRIPKGATRIIRAEYVGDAQTADSWRDHLVRVAAKVTIKANKKSLRNGQSVRLSGKVSQPVPAGKIVTIQGHDGRKWRTIANVRTNAKGSWKYAYRFTKTTGTRTYALRAQAPNEPLSVYDAGTSKNVRVKVRG